MGAELPSGVQGPPVHHLPLQSPTPSLPTSSVKASRTAISSSTIKSVPIGIPRMKCICWLGRAARRAAKAKLVIWGDDQPLLLYGVGRSPDG
jgi:hypothetical protein